MAAAVGADHHPVGAAADDQRGGPCPAGDQEQRQEETNQTSISLASAARSMMKRKRALASLPMSSFMTVSVLSASSTITRSAERRRGSSVVALRSSAGISPRPLKRLISGLVFLGAFFRILSFSWSSSAQ